MAHRILDIRGLADLDDGRINLPELTDKKQITDGRQEPKKKTRKTRDQRASEQERNWSRARFGVDDFEEKPKI